ncbi:hypothetical protein Y1Q_0004074 [Alligator mississippiensis]|uniref:Uncharacterized protein n=1 Tax=Alligator mississippiensis TaxID=8496 RepID=A0A151PHV7_ALLMI|nr:hypothetical protein Y1Q_0004074 [Alligator mississippiensis]
MSRIAFVFVMSEPWFRAPEIQAFKSDPENSLRCQAALWDFDIPNDYCAQRMPRLAAGRTVRLKLTSMDVTSLLNLERGLTVGIFVFCRRLNRNHLDLGVKSFFIRRTNI